MTVDTSTLVAQSIFVAIIILLSGVAGATTRRLLLGLDL